MDLIKDAPQTGSSPAVLTGLSLPKRFDYAADVLSQLSQVSYPHVVVEIGAFQFGANRYSLKAVEVGDASTQHLPNILVSAGVHGEEPAGVFAALRLLRDLSPALRSRYNFTILPCINPVGFEVSQRFGSGMKDLNRNFVVGSSEPEGAAVIDYLTRTNKRYELTIDLHEIDPNWAAEGFVATDNPHQFYIYEQCVDKTKRIGPAIVAAGKRFGEACQWESIYQDINTGGVIFYPEGCGNQTYAQGTTLEAFLCSRFTDHAFTFETPCVWELERRTKIHLEMIYAALESFAAL